MINTALCGSSLVDIRTVHVDKSLPKDARIAEYVKQIKNPYHYKCGKFTIIERHTAGGPSLEECLRRLMT
jgi:RecJ-like exonuclease